MARTMLEYRSDTTPITSFTLQRKDWKPLARYIDDSGKLYNRAMRQLSNLIDVEPAPANTALITTTKLTVGSLTRIVERFYPWGPISPQGRGRLVAEITALEAAMPDQIGGLIATIDGEWQAVIQEWETEGNLRLRDN